jgi:AcrR family transcriptional regulator
MNPPLGPDRGRRPRRMSGDERERAILATAESLLADRGLQEISVDDLARGAGISRPSFYFYFPSKEAVILSLLDRVVEEALASRGQALEQARSVPELWRMGLGTIFTTFSRHRALMLAVSQLAPGNEEIRKLLGRITGGFVEDTLAAIESERQRGRARPGPAPRALATALVWLTERAILAVITGMEPTLAEAEAFEVVLAVWSRAVYGDDTLGE